MDFGRMQETSDGDKDFEYELFTIYLEDCADRLQKVRDAVQDGNADCLHREAHTIKGSSANVGTTRLHELALALESADISDADGATSALISQLDEEFERVKDAIEAYLNGG